MQIKNGRKPLSARAAARPAPINLDDIFGNTLGIDPEVVKEIEGKGLTYRFVNATQLERFGGHHPRGWRVYKSDIISASDSIFGKSPDGYLRRGDCILAVRPKDLTEKHRAFLKQENARKANSQKVHAEELRKFARQSGLDLTVHEGYGADDENTQD